MRAFASINRHLVVDRERHELHLYVRKPFKMSFVLGKTYPIAVGVAGMETPRGLYLINHRSKKPSWTMPNSPWVEPGLRGTTLRFGDPDNPIKARWMGLDKGVGIHGTANRASIGHDASHGCIRMRVEDVEELFDQAPRNTPCYVI